MHFEPEKYDNAGFAFLYEWKIFSKRKLLETMTSQQSHDFPM